MSFMYMSPNCVRIKPEGMHLAFGPQKLELDYNEKGITPHDAVCLPSAPDSSNTRHVTVTGFEPHKVYTVTCARHGNVYLTVVHDRKNNQCVVTGTVLEGKSRLDKIDKQVKIYKFHGQEVKILYNNGLPEESPQFGFMNHWRGQHQSPWYGFGNW